MKPCYVKSSSNLNQVKIQVNSTFGFKLRFKFLPRWAFATLWPLLHIQLLPYQCDHIKSPNVYKSCPNMISLEKLMVFTHLQKLPKNVEDLGKLMVAQSAKNRPIWSHCSLHTNNNVFSCLVKSNAVILETSRTMILSPMMSFLWHSK